MVLAVLAEAVHGGKQAHRNITGAKVVMVTHITSRFIQSSLLGSTYGIYIPTNRTGGAGSVGVGNTASSGQAADYSTFTTGSLTLACSTVRLVGESEYDHSLADSIRDISWVSRGWLWCSKLL